jgi:iron(III) transport system ATP-binding protein
MQPKVLLFDEPLSNLDAKLRKRVREEIRDLQQALGITSVYVTHDQEEALAISDEIIVLRQGRIEQRGAPFALYSAPENRFVADFIGSASFLAGHYDGTWVSLAGFQFKHQQAIASGEVTVMVRPEAVLIQAEGLEAEVQYSSYLGSITEFVFHTEVGAVIASIPGEGFTALNKGSTVKLGFKPAGIHLLSKED